MSHPVSSSGRLAEMSPSLAWLSGLLWPVGSGSRVTLTHGSGRRPSDTRVWAVLPSAANPTLLAPASGRPGGSALHQFNDSMSHASRLRKVLVGVVIRSGAGALVSRDKLTVSVGGVDDASDLLDSVLPGIVGEPRIEVAISIGRQLRPNLKPVLQIMDPGGRVLAYVKIGWNDLTRDLIQNEARALRSWGSSPPRHFEVPRLIHEGEWNGLAIAVLSPIPHRLIRRGPRNMVPSVEVLREVAELGGSERSRLGGSPYWSRLRSRFDKVAVNGEMADAIRSILSRVEGSGDQELTFGCCHGDWAPWNMSHADGKLFVWDWERSARPVPVGFDALHFWFEVGFHKEHLEVADAGRSSFVRSSKTLERLGVDASARSTMMRLYLIERLLRVEEGRASGVPVHRGLSQAILRELDDWSA